MSGKRPSLAESMRQAVADPVPSAPIADPPRPKQIASPEMTTRPAGFYAATRAGKKKVTATLDPSAHKQLKGLAVEREVTTEALLTEAINDLFKKYGKPTG
jgi:hypothetical protein